MYKLSMVCLLALAAVALAGKEEHYTDRYNNVNVDEILSNNRLKHPYIRCALDLGKCSPEGKELKSHIREALENNCAKCDPKQREGARKVIADLINNEPDYWRQLVEKYDPQRKYTHKYEAELKKVQG